jgi:hypothetical protein
MPVRTPVTTAETASHGQSRSTPLLRMNRK